jgi:hypothetical protein
VVAAARRIAEGDAVRAPRGRPVKTATKLRIVVLVAGVAVV